MHSGHKIGDNGLVWFDVDIATVNQDRMVIVTVRRRYCNGDVIGREFATTSHVQALRCIANDIEKALKICAMPQVELRKDD